MRNTDKIVKKKSELSFSFRGLKTGTLLLKLGGFNHTRQHCFSKYKILGKE